jgi:DNA-binding MarR family transcriptional regulator
MVKKIDSTLIDDVGPDHVGWVLWKATTAWKRRFEAAMIEAGYPAFAEARGAILMHVGAQGIGQRELVARTGLTKQAVQQALEILEEEDLVLRSKDRADSRRRIVSRTEAGRAAYAVADRIKLQIEIEIQTEVGALQLREFLKVTAQISKLLTSSARIAVGTLADPVEHADRDSHGKNRS